MLEILFAQGCIMKIAVAFVCERETKQFNLGLQILQRSQRGVKLDGFKGLIAVSASGFSGFRGVCF